MWPLTVVQVFTIVLVYIYIGLWNLSEDKNEAYGVTLQQTDTLQKFEDDTPHIYEYPDSMMETKPNEA